jgi:polyisoprenyl-phosphate glycosyltransferase
MVDLSIVVQMYNEQNSCDQYFDTVLPILESLDLEFEILCVNDVSKDRTLEKLRAWRKINPRIKIVSLSRNFGKEAARAVSLQEGHLRVGGVWGGVRHLFTERAKEWGLKV